MKKLLHMLPCFLLFSTVIIAAQKDLSYLFPSKTVYFGVNMGGGSTEWKYLVDKIDNPPVDTTLPVAVQEGGPSWGVVFGYDVAKNFAIELQYMQFANSNITFDQNGYETYGYYNVVSKTDAYSLSGKFFVRVGYHTHLRAFAAIGAGVVQRKDPLVDLNPVALPSGQMASCVTPYMSSGLDYNFTRHWILEGGFQYYTGFGASQIDPVDSFIPFAWDAYGRLAYQL